MLPPEKICQLAEILHTQSLELATGGDMGLIPYMVSNTLHLLCALVDYLVRFCADKTHR